MDLEAVHARLASGGARVVGLVADDHHVLADVREGWGREEQRRLLLDDREVATVDEGLQQVPSLVAPLLRWVRVRPMFDLRWLDKGTPVEPHPLCLAARGDLVAVHLEHRDHKTGKPVLGRASGVVLELDADVRVCRWRRAAAFADALRAL